MAEEHLIIFFIRDLQEIGGRLAEAITLPGKHVPLPDGPHGYPGLQGTGRKKNNV